MVSGENGSAGANLNLQELGSINLPGLFLKQWLRNINFDHLRKCTRQWMRYILCKIITIWIILHPMTWKKNTFCNWSRMALSVACSLAVCSTSRNFCSSVSLTYRFFYEYKIPLRSLWYVFQLHTSLTIYLFNGGASRENPISEGVI